MVTFLVGILILILGYLFYSNYVVNQFEPDNRETPALKLNDGVDFIPLPTWKNMLIQLLNIAGMGPILGAIQGILFGPVAFIIIPVGCIFMGGVHDYFSGMLSSRNDGAQITTLIKKYLGKTPFLISIVVVSIMLLLLTSVFIYTSADIMAESFWGQADFSLKNPVMIWLYCAIGLYYIVAALFPIDKIIGKLYPLFTMTLIFGSLLVLIGFCTKGVVLQELNFNHINMNPDGYHLLPMFFVTISCGLLSGFHSTQSTIISRTIKNEYCGKKVFYLMMCLEALIAMIWAAAAMHVYTLNLVPQNQIGTAIVVNDITDAFVSPILAFVVTLAVVILPITSGDTALRSLRMTIAEVLNIKQKKIINRLKIVLPVTLILFAILVWAKSGSGTFTLIWRYFNFTNQLIAIPTFLYASIYLYKKGKNYLITLLPGIFYIFILTFFLLSSKIGFNISYKISEYVAILVTLISTIFIIKYFKKSK